MDNRSGGQGNPYDRPYYGDPNVLRQQIPGYANSPGIYPYSQQQQQDGFSGRRPGQDQLGLNNHATARTNSLTSPPQSTNPWMHSYHNQTQPNSMSPNFNMNIPNMFHTRWEQDQASLLQQREMMQREEHARMMYRERLQMQERENQLKIQMQKEQERELQLQREKEAQLQREREAKVQREREAQLERERQAQLQRERQAALEKERQLQLQREREVQLQREAQLQYQMQREMQLEREREVMAIRERDAILERDRKAMLYRDAYFAQQHQPQQFPNHFGSMQNTLPNLNFTQSNESMSNQFNFYNQPSMHSNGNLPSSTSSSILNFSMDQIFNPNKISESPVSKAASTSSSFHFPISSPSTVSSTTTSSTTTTTTALRKSSSNSFDNGIINSIVSDKGFLTSPLDSNSQFMKTWQELQDMDLSEIEKNVLGPKDQDSRNTPLADTPFSNPTTPTEMNGLPPKPIDSNLNNIVNSLPENSLDLNKHSIETKESLQITNTEDTPPQQNLLNHPRNLLSVSQTAQASSNYTNTSVTQSDINLTHVSENLLTHNRSCVSSFVSPTSSDLYCNQDFDKQSKRGDDIKHEEYSNELQSNHSKSYEKQSSSSPTTLKQKSKQSFSSIESFLGMSSDSKKTEDNDNERINDTTKKRERIPSSDVQDRISVIKPLPISSPQISNTSSPLDIVNNDHDTLKSPQAIEKLKSPEEIQKVIDHSESASVTLIHPSMRLKKQRSLSNSSMTATSPQPVMEKEKPKTSNRRPLHPSMRLQTNKNNTKVDKAEPKKSKVENLDNSFDSGKNILHSPKTGRYQSELSSTSTKSSTRKLSPFTPPTVTSPLTSPPLVSPGIRSPFNGKPLTGKPFSTGKPVHGGKPASYSAQGGGKPMHMGGKPTSFSSHMTVKEEKSPEKEHTGKPLSFLKSMVEESSKNTNTLQGKKITGKKRPRKETIEKPASKETLKKDDISKSPDLKTSRITKMISTPPSSQKLTDNIKTKKPPQEKQAPVKKLPVKRSPKVSPPKREAVKDSPLKENPFRKSIVQAKSKPVLTKQKNLSKENIEELSTSEEKDSPKKTFKFKGITFDAKTEDDDSSDSDSDSSSNSDSGSSSDSSDNSGTEEEIEDIEDEDDDDTASQTSSVTSSPAKKTQRAGQKRKAVPDNAEVIASLKKRKVVDLDLIKAPLKFGWRRQTRLRPNNAGDGLRGDVYYYSPCGKKLRTYPELNSYIFRNDVVDVDLKNFSFSTKLRVGEFMQAKDGSKFVTLTEEEIDETFVMMEERRSASAKRAEEKKREKREKEEKQRQILEERKKKREEALERKRSKEEERRKVQKDKALEAKMKKEKEKEAAQEAKRLKEEAIMLKKLERQAQMEASRIAKREKVQNMLAEKQKMKEQREHERVMKIENQKVEKEMKLQAIENEKERKRLQQVKSKVSEKEKRKRELVMMKAYEAQRRAEERERLKEQKKLEKTLIRQRKLEQKRYERMISKELKKPIDDMALNDLKPLPELPRVTNINIPGKAYADILMVQEFVHAFGHVIDIDPEKEFPSMGELQSSLLCESGSDEAIFTACQALLFYALYDPGVSGPYAKTSLGSDLTSIELNENNISEVLRLFIMSRNEGKQHTLSDQLTKYPLEALSPSSKASVLAFIVNELLCGKSVSREIDGSLENISNMRRDKWNLEGDIRKLKADLLSKQPKKAASDQQQNLKNNKGESKKRDSDEENNSDDEGTTITTAKESNIDLNDTAEDTEAENQPEMVNPTTLDQMEKKLRLMEKKHARYRKKLFDSSHTIRGINLGQDRYRRRYFVLPNAGGIYVEGLESGFFDEETNVKTKEEKEECKEHLDSLLTTLKSPTVLKSPVTGPKTPATNTPSVSALSSNSNELLKPKQESPIQTQQQQKQIKVENPCLSDSSYVKSWFSLRTKKRCESYKTSAIRETPKERKHSLIVAPRIEGLADDHQFLESIYSCYSTTSPGGKNTLLPVSRFPLSKESMHRNSLLGLPAELDMNLLIQQDPQKAAEILEIQTAKPQEIPPEMQAGWWRITDPEQMQRLNKCAHARGMRERNLQKTVVRFQDYTNSSCKVDHLAFSLLLPDEESESKDKVTEDDSSVATSTDTNKSIQDKWYPQLAYASDKAILIEVEELEEKVFSASLQVKGWRLSQKISPALLLSTSNDQAEYDPPEDKYPIRIAASRLLALELGIERRYMKPPFRTPDSLPKPDAPEAKEEPVKNPKATAQLEKWREAVSEAKSSAQLSMCITALFECVAWEKSIMKVFCILCRKSDNEERLLLCDACDRGCHTYCCKPKFDKIPDGDWFCQDCVLMASGSDQCYKCKSKTGRRLKCAFCPRHYHMDCLEPPLHKTPRSPWSCPVCKKTRSKSKPPQRKKPRAEELLKKEEQSKQKSMSNSRVQTSKDMEPCRFILNEMENHESSWPFLVPVNMKQFPEYYKVIKHPMDFHTMKTKLRDYQYKSKEEFARDARLVFFNCKTYNEDESEVGCAGEAMRSFFEKRWTALKKGVSSTNSDNKFHTNKKGEGVESSGDEGEDAQEEGEGDEEVSSSSSEEISSESESSEVEEDSENETDSKT